MVERDPDILNSPSNAKRKVEDGSDSLLGSHSLVDEEGPQATLKRRRVIGPMTGPAEDYNRDAHKNVNDAASEQNDDSSDEDDFGPSLPPREDNRSYQDHEAHTDSYSTGNSLNPSVENDPSYGKKNKRDEWMVLPPDKSSWVSNIDPTSLRNRKFTTGRSVRNSQGDNSGIGSSWTETPAEKKIRLENEIMGIQAPAENNSHGTSGRPLKTDSTTADKIRQFNGKKGGPSLYETHKYSSKDEKDDDPSARPFDREKDISGPANVTDMARREMLKRAADYGSRFSSGQFL